MNKGVEQLSDYELQEKLLAKGYPKTPVTETTRGILLNKLQNTFVPNAGHVNNRRSDQIFKNDASTRRRRLNELQSSVGPETFSKLYTYKSASAIYSDHKNNHTFKAYLTPSKGECPRKNKIYTTSSDCAINGLPQTNISLATCTESHLGVVNRLLSFRDKTFRNQKTCESNLQSVLAFPKETNKYLCKSKRTMFDIISYIRNQSRLNQSFKPYLLVGAFVIFFFCLAFIYIFQSPNSYHIDNISSTIPICDGSLTKADCIPAADEDNAINLIKEIGKMLKLRSKKYRCSNKILISETELSKYMEAKGRYCNIYIWRKNLLFAKLLIKQNPQWNMETIEGEDTSFKLLISNPLFCILYTKIQSFFVIIGIGAVVALLSGLIFTMYRYIRDWRLNRFNIIEQFTTDIVNELIYRASLSESPEERDVIITHLREKLVPLKNRPSHLKFWKEALKLLEATDSRIQFGVKICHGEEYRTMKWIGNANANVQTNGLLKKWQSPAFDYTNKINNPPTSCLKIRHMFDSSEADISNLKQIIEAALIEKVGSRCCIQDIQIDKQSCCVYVRCGSEIDAGIIHNETNGWWFDKRLISIKFLRLQRYLARFPNSANTGPLLTQ